MQERLQSENRQLLCNLWCNGKLLLVTKVCIVFIESAQISIIGGCGTEEDGRR